MSLNIILQIILAIPKLAGVFRELFKFVRSIQYKNDLKKNDEIQKELENAKTPEEVQKAADDIANRLGHH